MAKIKITADQIDEWFNAEEYSYELCGYLADILNGSYQIPEARQEILNYHGINRDED